jgi:hypothetical protein
MKRPTLIGVMSMVVCLWAAAVHAQYRPASPLMLAPGQSHEFAAMEARAKAKSQALRRAWLAAGHTLPEASTGPAILSGAIRTPSIDVDRPPATPEISVKYKTGPSGLDFVDLYFYSNTTSQYEYIGYSPDYYAPVTTHGTLTYEPTYDRFSLYAAPGDWTLSYAYIYDRAGNYTFYDATQLAALFPSVTISVTSHYADTVNPTVSAGKLLTPKISLSSSSPVFAASLTAADNDSGVAYIYIDVEPPGGSYGYSSYGSPPVPLKSGTITSYLSLENMPTGTWTIYGYEACDAAGNCLFDGETADIQALFGTTTFTVTD